MGGKTGISGTWKCYYWERICLCRYQQRVSQRSQEKGDRGVVLCLDEKTGDLKWQLVIPKLGAGKVSDWEYIGVCSSPAIDGDKVYVVTNRCEVVCLDIHGLSNGNDGPYQDEAEYVRPKGMSDPLDEKLDADILWMYDMRDELGFSS